MLSFVVLALLSGLVLLAALGWFREREAIDEWDVLLSPEGRLAYLRLRESWAAEVDVADWSFRTAMFQRDHGERLRLLGASAAFLMGLVPGRLEQLRRLRLYSRMAAALAPLPPVNRTEYRLRPVRRIAAMGEIVHHVLVTVAERFLLRLFVLRHGFLAVVRSLFRSRRRWERAGSPDAEWWRVVAAREDFKTLDEDTLESCKVVVMALGRVHAHSPMSEATAPH